MDASDSGSMTPGGGGNIVVDVVVPVAVDTAYSYRVPAGLDLKPGDFVDVPLGTREAIGVVWEVRRTPAGSNLKSINGKCDYPSFAAPMCS